MMFFNFWNFFAFIIQFSNSGRVRTNRKEIIFVLYFSACPCPFRLETKPGWRFLIFRIFLHLLLKFQTRVWFERIGRKFFSSLFFGLSSSVSSWNETWLMFFNFWNFFAFIIEFSNSGRVRTDRKEIIFVLYFSACPRPFRLGMKPGWCFLIFKIFFHLFLNLLTRVRVFKRIGRKLLLFSIFLLVHARLRLETKPGWCFIIFRIFLHFIIEISILGSGWNR